MRSFCDLLKQKACLDPDERLGAQLCASSSSDRIVHVCIGAPIEAQECIFQLTNKVNTEDHWHVSYFLFFT